MSSFIGKGERTVVEVLKMITKLHESCIPYLRLGFQSPAIYTQVSMSNLLKPSLFEQLDPPHQKSSVDVVLLTPKQHIVCYRIQGKGHQGLHKAKFDVVQKKFLEDAGCYVVDIHIWECSNVFQEKINFMSFFEITDAMRRAALHPKFVEISDGS